MPTGSIMNTVATILVVDTDPASRDAICDVLEKGGHDAQGASGAEDALQKMRHLHGSVDLIVIDPELPALTDGVYLLRRIRQRFANLPAVVISEHLTSLEEASGITRALDVAELITKPLDANVLSAAVIGALAAS